MTTYTAIVKTPEWAGSETFNFDVAADTKSQAETKVRQLIGRDLPQGGEIVAVHVREVK